MGVVFHRATNSIITEHTLEEYQRAMNVDGVPPWPGVYGAIASHVSLRHEHAHFASYLASGLSELGGVFSDLRLALAVEMLERALREGSEVLEVPLLPDKERLLSTEQWQVVLEVHRQSYEVEGYFFGIGSRRSVDELFRFGPLDRLLDSLRSPLLQFNLARYRRFLKQILFTTPPHLRRMPAAASVRVQTGDGKLVTLSPSAVMEAYAITIEVVAEYIKTVRTSLNQLRTEPKRLPARIHLIAIEMILESLYPDKKIAIDEYVFGGADSDVYWSVALVAFAAMQIPILEDLQGDTLIMGTLKQLNLPMRLSFILRAINEKAVPHPSEVKGSENGPEILRWLEAAHAAIGDLWTTKLNATVHELVAGMPDTYAGPSTSLNQASWLTRAKLMVEPYEMIADGGVWLGIVPSFIRTADQKILLNGPVEDQSMAFADYVARNASHILEGIVFERSWDICWSRVGEFEPSVKEQASTIAVATMLRRTDLPSVRIRK